MAEATVTVPQLCEYLGKEFRRICEHLEKIRRGEISRREIQQEITKSAREPKEQLARLLLRKADRILEKYSERSIDRFRSEELQAEITCLRARSGFMGADTAAKIAVRFVADRWRDFILLQLIELHCHDCNFVEAIRLTHWLAAGRQSLGWAAVVGASREKDEAIYERACLEFHRVVFSSGEWRFKAYARAGELESLIKEIETGSVFAGADYARATIEALVSANYLVKARNMAKFIPECWPEVQFDAWLTIVRASRGFLLDHRNDLGTCRIAADHSKLNPFTKVNNWGRLAAVSRDKDDFAKCLTLSTEMSGYGGGLCYLAIAHAAMDEIKEARSLADSIVDPYWEAKALIGIAREVLTQK